MHWLNESRRNMESLLSDVEILVILYRYITGTELPRLVNGRVLYEGTRPLDSRSEDIVLAFNSGNIADYQQSYLYVRIYVDDFDNGSGVKVKDLDRCKAIAGVCNRIFKEVAEGDYIFSLDEVPHSNNRVDVAQQHVVTCKLLFENNY